MQSIRQELAEIKAAMGIDDIVASTLDINKLIIPGKYNARYDSTGLPENNKEYILDVSYYGDNNVLQIAYEKESDNVYYRSTLAIISGEPEWSSWTLLRLQS